MSKNCFLCTGSGEDIDTKAVKTNENSRLSRMNVSFIYNYTEIQESLHTYDSLRFSTMSDAKLLIIY